MSFKPPSEISVTSRQIPKWGGIPNTSVQSKPLMIYHKAFNASASDLATHLEEIGEVRPQWVYSMYSQTHFHSTTHEVLGVVSGRARLCFGGEANPERFEPTVEKGDLIIVSAGVGHRLLDDLGAGHESFKMVGAYPPQKQWDMCYGESREENKVSRNIQELDWFHSDPLYGTDGPVLQV
ncbi:cupin domain protein [Aspergillus sclerotioniger CBS 115572]|uniref:Cupin domain protein n=1 Tax=Aspergillus sclerotioniger CBS 115572 TaxID=1450535 RepID=A0A317X8D3_9EURO|nr:cupin domain protein [Aspergillus sclerotioniger CBS 115572]PWY94853.1 cupin domain protein [Aspergillus sclerotioniger CBS 115572]